MFRKLLGRKGLAIIGGSIAGNMFAERWLLKAGPDDPQGFVMVADGIGLDDFVRGASIAMCAFFLDRFLS